MHGQQYTWPHCVRRAATGGSRQIGQLYEPSSDTCTSRISGQSTDLSAKARWTPAVKTSQVNQAEAKPLDPAGSILYTHTPLRCVKDASRVTRQPSTHARAHTQAHSRARAHSHTNEGKHSQDTRAIRHACDLTGVSHRYTTTPPAYTSVHHPTTHRYMPAYTSVHTVILDGVARHHKAVVGAEEAVLVEMHDGTSASLRQWSGARVALALGRPKVEQVRRILASSLLTDSLLGTVLLATRRRGADLPARRSLQRVGCATRRCLAHRLALTLLRLPPLPRRNFPLHFHRRVGGHLVSRAAERRTSGLPMWSACSTDVALGVLY